MGWFERKWDKMPEEEREDKYIKFGFGVRDLKAENHWREAAENFSFADKKTILILPGSGTNSAGQANGMCKIAEDMIPENIRDSWQICSMHYADSYTIHIPTVIRAQRMFDKYFVPLIAHKDDNDDLHRLPTQEAMKNMRNLVIFTHCYGGYIMDALEEQLKQTMQELNYSPEEQALIAKQLFVIQHNNIENEIENNPSATTQLIRISQDDDERCAGDMKYGTFSHYLQTRNIQDDEVSYIKISENRRILYAKRITEQNVSEHNGGYWQDLKHKTLAGFHEDMVARIIFEEVLSSDYQLENMEQIIKNACKKNPGAKEEMTPALNVGKAVTDGYIEYSQKYNGGFKALYDKLLGGKLRKEDILRTDTDVCFVQDRDDKFLMDHLLEHNQFKLAQVLFQKMIKNARVFDYDHSLHLGRDSRNKIKAVEQIQQWGQIAVDKNQHELFAQMAKIAPRLWKLDYAAADVQTLKIAAENVFTDKNFPRGLCDQNKFMPNLLQVYKRNEELPASPEKQAVRNAIEKFLFAKDSTKEIYGKENIIKDWEKQGMTRLVNLAKTSWISELPQSTNQNPR